MNKKYLLFTILFLMILNVIYFYISNTESLEEGNIINKETFSTSTGELKDNNQEEVIKENLKNYRELGNNEESFFLFLCNNNEYIEKYFDEKFGKDKELLKFLKSSNECRYSFLDAMLDKTLLTNKKLHRFLYDECNINEIETEQEGYFLGYFSPTYPIMLSYYIGLDNIDKTIYYLEKFATIPEEDFIYYNRLEIEYSKLFKDVLEGKQFNPDICIDYIK
ncbi:MAG: hypothetical protein QM490_02300 [Candidatus Gracilibacteria bacterium]